MNWTWSDAVFFVVFVSVARESDTKDNETLVMLCDCGSLDRGFSVVCNIRTPSVTALVENRMSASFSIISQLEILLWMHIVKNGEWFLWFFEKSTSGRRCGRWPCATQVEIHLIVQCPNIDIHKWHSFVMDQSSVNYPFASERKYFIQLLILTVVPFARGVRMPRLTGAHSRKRRRREKKTLQILFGASRCQESLADRKECRKVSFARYFSRSTNNFDLTSATFGSLSATTASTAAVSANLYRNEITFRYIL